MGYSCYIPIVHGNWAPIINLLCISAMYIYISCMQIYYFINQSVAMAMGYKSHYIP